MIEGGHLEAGERLAEARVAKLIGMGRGPVRESLLRLEAEGLLERTASRRSRMVAYLEDENPAELLCRYELREQIESGAVRAAAKNMTGWQIERLLWLVQQFEDAWKSDDRQARHNTVQEFHQFLMVNCGNPLFLEVWQTHRLAPTQSRSPQVEDAILASLPIRERREAMVEVAKAIAAHDPDRAESMMKQAIRGITEALRKHIWKTDAEQAS